MRRLPRFRFSLRALLIGVIVLSIALGGFSLIAFKARRQADAVKTMQRLGATIYYDFHHYYDPDSTINRWRKPTDWMWARIVLGNDFFSNVYLVEFIEYRDTHLRINGRFTSFMGPIPTPTELSRNADKYVHLLESLPNLSRLDLNHSEVSDAAIPALAKLDSLKALWVDDTNITAQGAARLGKLLPGCTIRWRPKSHDAAARN
jgi:hypothetical protein